MDDFEQQEIKSKAIADSESVSTGSSHSRWWRFRLRSQLAELLEKASRWAAPQPEVKSTEPIGFPLSSGRPPAHWLELVAKGAPQLLQPALASSAVEPVVGKIDLSDSEQLEQAETSSLLGLEQTKSHLVEGHLQLRPDGRKKPTHSSFRARSRGPVQQSHSLQDAECESKSNPRVKDLQASTGTPFENDSSDSSCYTSSLNGAPREVLAENKLAGEERLRMQQHMTKKRLMQQHSADGLRKLKPKMSFAMASERIHNLPIELTPKQPAHRIGTLLQSVGQQGFERKHQAKACAVQEHLLPKPHNKKEGLAVVAKPNLIQVIAEKTASTEWATAKIASEIKRAETKQRAAFVAEANTSTPSEPVSPWARLSLEPNAHPASSNSTYEKNRPQSTSIQPSNQDRMDFDEHLFVNSMPLTDASLLARQSQRLDRLAQGQRGAPWKR